MGITIFLDFGFIIFWNNENSSIKTSKFKGNLNYEIHPQTIVIYNNKIIL